MTATISPDQFLDPIWRLSNLYTIMDKRGRAVPFTPNSAQLNFLTNMHTRNLILKARQLGFTTVSCLAYLDDCIFNPNVRAGIIAHKQDDAKVIFRDKIKFPWEHLDIAIREKNPTMADSADTLTWANNSSIRVSTSMRSGTVQWLHISEYGKICSQFPDKAHEIKTGAFPAAEQGVITIESTAEGQEGDFFDRSQRSQALANAGAELSPQDYKFFFYPWWGNPEYSLERTAVAQAPEDDLYFKRVEGEAGIELTQGQKNWWLSQSADLGGDMKREYPATPKEAFEQSLEGAYFADQIAFAEKMGRIGDFPIDPGLPVNTFWDLGRNDDNVIWLEQDRGTMATFVGYYEMSGEWIGHYINWLEDWKRENKIQFGKHYLPHDGDRQSLWLPEGTMATMNKLNFRPTIVERTNNLGEEINVARRKFQSMAFDKNACKIGLQRLKAYRKEWNDRLGVWHDRPRHDQASHAASGILTFTSSNHSVKPKAEPTDRYRKRTDNDDYGSAWAV